jgi:hypothetical protein
MSLAAFTMDSLILSFWAKNEEVRFDYLNKNVQKYKIFRIKSKQIIFLYFLFKELSQKLHEILKY